jgi:hypothetical protein
LTSPPHPYLSRTRQVSEEGSNHRQNPKNTHIPATSPCGLEDGKKSYRPQ